MNISNLSQLIDTLKDKRLKTVVVVSANDDHTVAAVGKAVADKLVKGILVGDQPKMLHICSALGFDPEMFVLIDEPDDSKAALKAIELINKGGGDVLMKGLISTDKFMKAVLNKEKGLTDPGRVVSHVTLIENSSYHKLMVVGDVAVIPQPDLNQKIQIINYLVWVANRLGIRHPKVAAIAPTELVIASIASTTESALLSKMVDRRQIKECIFDGPLALDVAIDREAATIKGIKSPVAGDADCLLFPNLESGNVFYKTNTKLSNAKSAAIMVGARVPVVLASRGDSSEAKLYSIALGALMAQ